MLQMHNNSILFNTYFTDYPQGPQNLTTLTPSLDVQTSPAPQTLTAFDGINAQQKKKKLETKQDEGNSTAHVTRGFTVYALLLYMIKIHGELNLNCLVCDLIS